MEVETRRKETKPRDIDPERVCDVISKLFGFGEEQLVFLRAMDSYDDMNLLLERPSTKEKFTLKIHNGVDSEEDHLWSLSAQSKVLLHLNEHGVTVPRPIPSSAQDRPCDADTSAHLGHTHVLLQHNDVAMDGHDNRDVTYAARLLTFVDGRLLYDVPQTLERLQSLGEELGRMAHALGKISIRERSHAWDLQKFPDVQALQTSIDNADAEKHRFINEVFQRFSDEVEPVRDALPRSVIHCDPNDNNVIVLADCNADDITCTCKDASLTTRSGTRCCGHVKGFIDFGDMVTSWRIADLAIAIAYACIGKDDPIAVSRAITAGYLSFQSLSEMELAVVHTLACARLVTSGIMSAYSYARNPDPYLLIHAGPAWSTIAKLLAMSPEEIARFNSCDTAP